MPCYYTGSAEGDARLEAQEANENLTQVTRLLCEVCQKFENKLPKNVQVWWSEHKKIDEEQKRNDKKEKMREKLLKSARAKLTKEEQDAMGL